MDGKNVDSRVVVDEGGIQRVLFSMHSSLEEIQDMVQTLKPRKVTPIAKPDPVTTETVFKKKEILYIIYKKFYNNLKKNKPNDSKSSRQCDSENETNNFKEYKLPSSYR